MNIQRKFRFTSQERIKKIMNFEIPDKVAKRDNYWTETITRWHQEGLPEEETPYEYFGTEKEWGGVWAMPGLGFEEKVLEETDRYIIKKDWNGNIVKGFKNGQGWTPQPIKFLIKNKKYAYQLSYLKACLRAKPDEIMLGGSVSSMSIISPTIFRTIIYHLFSRLLNYVSKRG